MEPAGLLSRDRFLGAFTARGALPIAARLNLRPGSRYYGIRPSALEWCFSEDGLAELAGGEDLATEVARTLAENIRLEDTGRAWAKVAAKKPKAAAKPEAEPRIDPFATPSRQPAASHRRTVRRKRTRRAARVVALPAFG